MSMTDQDIMNFKLMSKPPTTIPKRMKLTKTEKKVLNLLEKHGASEWPIPITQRQIGTETGLHLSQVWKALDGLRFKEYILAVKWGRFDIIAVIKGITKNSNATPKSI
ncbi:hypothetical protein KP001_07965 [Geomonas subterranea]|uniref:Uncharacterized protein n=1 Tax=Geomonas subterranea TaxID=2847989 RepID=A0ABX8LL93_9BACT|nr:hypothetical protein [Geomonas subterranea]QXE92447.1 hypothetical protein KP001_07965 [Geomonas subterranea]QXM09454.1 hypothetical protein KP002_21305 [Geomonas subterranea]